jgi:hypothetical protein
MDPRKNFHVITSSTAILRAKFLRNEMFPAQIKNFSVWITLVPEVYFYYFHCEGERKNKPLVESGNRFIEPRQSV